VKLWKWWDEKLLGRQLQATAKLSRRWLLCLHQDQAAAAVKLWQWWDKKLLGLKLQAAAKL
jgi:hypothetical protein